MEVFSYTSINELTYKIFLELNESNNTINFYCILYKDKKEVDVQKIDSEQLTYFLNEYKIYIKNKEFNNKVFVNFFRIDKHIINHLQYMTLLRILRMMLKTSLTLNINTIDKTNNMVLARTILLNPLSIVLLSKSELVDNIQKSPLLSIHNYNVMLMISLLNDIFTFFSKNILFVVYSSRIAITIISLFIYLLGKEIFSFQLISDITMVILLPIIYYISPKILIAIIKYRIRKILGL